MIRTWILCFVFVHGSLLFANEPEPLFEKVVGEYICNSKITLIPTPTGKLDPEIYNAVQNFWQSYVPGITIRVSKHPPKKSGLLIFVKVGTPRFFALEENNGSYAVFLARNLYFSKRFGGSCYTAGSIVLNNSFIKLPKDLQKEYLAHEFGHVLGLRHRDDNIMAEVGSFGFTLDEDQIKALTVLYPAR